MFIVTHTLLPVCAGMGVEHASLARGGGYLFPERGLFAIGFFGALPDICTPHISLAARYSSWSHTAWFLIGLLILAPVVASFFPAPGRWRLAIACWLAAALHLFCDAIAGGIAWLWPWRSDVLGTYLIPPSHWLAWDFGILLLTWLLVRLRPHAVARGMARGMAR